MGEQISFIGTSIYTRNAVLIKIKLAGAKCSMLHFSSETHQWENLTKSYIYIYKYKNVYIFFFGCVWTWTPSHRFSLDSTFLYEEICSHNILGTKTSYLSRFLYFLSIQYRFELLKKKSNLIGWLFHEQQGCRESKNICCVKITFLKYLKNSNLSCHFKYLN